MNQFKYFCINLATYCPNLFIPSSPSAPSYIYFCGRLRGFDMQSS